jgi:hypothetical protein
MYVVKAIAEQELNPEATSYQTDCVTSSVNATVSVRVVVSESLIN